MRREPIRINIIHVELAIFAVVFIVLIIITLMQVFRTNPYGPGLRIDNLSDYVEDLPEGRRDSMFAMLYRAVELNLPEGANIPDSGALIREGSANNHYDEVTDVHSGNFIVDIERIRQSYQVQYEWSPDERNRNLSGYQMMVTCLPANLVIYEDFECKDMFSAGDFDPYGTVALYLPYYGKTQSGAAIYIQIGTFISGARYLEINVNSCGNQSVLGEADKYAKEWVESLGFKSDEFVSEVRDLCDGGS